MGTTERTPGGTPGALSLEQLLEVFEPDTGAPHPVSVQRALHVARHLQRRAMKLQAPSEKRQQRELERMMEMPHDKATLMQMTDQALRAKRPPRAADQLIHLFDVQGIPRFFSTLDRALLKGFQSKWYPDCNMISFLLLTSFNHFGSAFTFANLWVRRVCI